MAKEKAKGVKGVPNKHLHARVAYLQQAAKYLALQRCAPNEANDPSRKTDSSHEIMIPIHQESGPPLETPQPPSEEVTKQLSKSSGMPQHLASQLRQVALKAQIRLDPLVKRDFCKICNAVLIEGETCLKFTENLSRGGRKPHADTLVLECQACGMKKRLPMAMARQQKKGERRNNLEDIAPADANKANQSVPS